VTVLIVGGGKMGLSHLALAGSLVGSSNVAICDASLALRFAYRNLGKRTFASVPAALGSLRGKVSAAIVATPTSSHYPIASSLLQASIPCFVEKPLTLNPERSAELARIAAARGVHAQVGFVLRYVATFVTLRRLVASGRFGPAISYRARMSGNVITGSQGDTWRSDYARGGGCLNEYGPHLIDLCRYVFGDIAGIHSAIATQVHSRRADDRMTASWTHACGTNGQLDMDWCDTTRRKSVIQLEVSFSHARVVLDNSTLKILDVHPDHAGPPGELRTLEFIVPPRVSFYLRGEEYSLQLEEFLGRSLQRSFGMTPFEGAASPALLVDGLAVDQLIAGLAQKAGLA
jgi:predicted dehydrogenase